MTNILLTSGGLTENMKNIFFSQIKKKKKEIKVLLVPSAGIHTDSAREGVHICAYELINMGILPSNIVLYPLQVLISADYKRTYSEYVENLPLQYRLLSVDELSKFDAIFFSGGNAEILMSEMKRTGFGEIVCQSVKNSLFYVGVSAGSMIGAGNYRDGLRFIENEIEVHCSCKCKAENITDNRKIELCDGQAIYITENFKRIIE